MTSSAYQRSNETEKRSIKNDEEHAFIHNMGWKGLFSFTTKKHFPVLGAACLGAAVAALTMPALAILYGFIFREYADFGAGKTSGAAFLRNTSRYCTYLVAVGGLNWLANSIYFMSFLTFGELQARSARNWIFKALLRKNISWYETRETGAAAFLPAVQMQIRDLQLSVSQPFGEVVQCFFQTLGALGVAFYSSWNLTLVVICSVPLVYVVMALLSKVLSKRAHEQSDTLQQALKYITSAIRHIETVKCFNGERLELQRYTGIISKAGKLHNSQARFRGMQLGTMAFFTLSVFCQGFWYGSRLVFDGRRDAGQVITTFWAALMAVQGITGFLPQFIVLQKGKVAGARLRALLMEITDEDSSTEMGGDNKPTGCSGCIKFKNVSFAYPSRIERPALSNVSLSFPTGSMTFLVGRSGSGKSTIGQLLVRFYQPTSGQIYLDEIPLHDLDVHWLRDNVTLVEQHSVLFNDSIRYNVALGKKGADASSEEVSQAISFAMLEQMVKDLPSGLETQLGAQGSGLSGGQKQRMALARARVRDTPVLVLDESTSALDYTTRSAIISAIRAWRQNKTTIIITHDISQIQPEDWVIIMDNTRVVRRAYRKALRAEADFVFKTFLEPHQDGTVDSREHLRSPFGQTDAVISLYSTSADMPDLSTRPQSESGLFFRESLLSPFLSPRPSSIAGSVNSASRRPSISSERDIAASSATILPPDALENSMPLAARRSMSVASQRLSLQDPPLERPLSLALDSKLPTLVEKANAPSFRKTFRERMERLRKRRSADRDTTSAVHTLPIMELLSTVWPLIGWRYRIALIGAIICSLIHSGITPTFAYAFSQLVSTFFTPGHQQERAQAWALAILGIAIADGLASYGYNTLFDISAQTWANALKVESMKRILFQPREFFDREENNVSHLSECLDQFAEEARNLPGRFVGVLIVMIFTVCVAVTWSCIISWKLTLVALGCLGVMFCITRVYNAISSRWERFSNEADEQVGQILHETFVNIKTVRCLVLEEVFHAKYRTATANALKIGTKRSIYSGSIFGLNYSSSSFISALLFWWGAYIVIKGEYTSTDIITAFNVLMISVAHANHIGHYIPQINNARDAGSRLMRLARLPQDSHELQGTEQLFSTGDIVLQDVSFAYPARKEHTVLHGITFDIPRGSCIAIVGTSGSGKSTVAALLMKLYQTATKPIKRGPDISISDHDIKRLHTVTLRSRIAIVSQTPVIFPGTIAENITYGLTPSSQFTSADSVSAAASAAGIAEFIDSLTDGYQTVIGDGGTGISGGQAQRIAIARAIIREPDVLILDEATSALDVESAGIVRDTVRDLVKQTKQDYVMKDISRKLQAECKKSMTVIIITHAREMMAIAEHIVMLEKGRVVEEGAFEDLKRRRGPFARLLRGEDAVLPERMSDV